MPCQKGQAGSAHFAESFHFNYGPAKGRWRGLFIPLRGPSWRERESSISVPLMCNRAILIERQSQAEVFYEPKSVEPSKMPLLFAANICKLFYKGK